MDIYNPADIRRSLEPLGFHFSKGRGQNFLIDADAAEQIAGLLPENSGVLEIGPGFGSLTEKLLPLARKLTVVEIDGRLAAVIEARYGSYEHFHIIGGDALKIDISQIAQDFTGLTPVVVSNMPYSRTTEMIEMLMNAKQFKFLFLTIQKEAAERICAQPGDGNYGFFTVFCRVFCDCKILFDIPPDSFYPSPSIYSSVIKFSRRDLPLVPPDKMQKFMSLTRTLFNQRRKTLLNAVSPVSLLTRQELRKRIEQTGISPEVRGETLGIDDYLILLSANII